METKKNYWYLAPYFLIILLSIACAIMVGVIKKKNSNISQHEQNIKALNDSVRITKNKVGDLEFSKNILVGDLDVLKKNNSDLYELYKNSRGKIYELSQYITKIDNKGSDNIETELVDYDNFRYGLKWENDTIFNKDNSRELAGESIFDLKFNNGVTEIKPFKTIITKDITTLKVSQGLRKNGNNIEVFVTSSHPNFKVSELNSIIINPEDHISKDFTPKNNKRFGLGANIGYGISKHGLTPTFNIGLNYNVVQF